MIEVRSRRSELRFRVIKFVYYTLRTIGIAPFSIKTKTSTDKFRGWSKMVFLYSKTGLVYNILLTIMLWVHTAFALLGWYDIFRQEKIHPFLFYDFLITLLFRGLAAIAAVTFWTIRQRNAIHVMNRLLEVDGLLRALKHQAFEKRTNIWFPINVIIGAFIFCNMFIAERYQDLLYTNNRYVNLFLYELPSILTYVFNFQYSILLGLVVRNLERVNKNLSSFTEFQNYPFLGPFFTNYSAVISSWPNQRSNEHLTALKSLRAIRTTLSEVSQDFADLFSLPILFVVTAYFLGTIDLLFAFLFFGADENQKIDTLYLIYTIGWLLVKIQPLIILLAMMNQVRDKARLTASVVNTAIAKSVNREFKGELEDFSLQLLSEDIVFSAYGFFHLNNQILHSMLGALATYFLILYQTSIPESDLED